jgi:hypothetical protein
MQHRLYDSLLLSFELIEPKKMAERLGGRHVLNLHPDLLARPTGGGLV